MAHEVDQHFRALPARALADAALSRARQRGAQEASLRLESIRSQRLSLKDARLETSAQSEQVGFGVRVVVDGTWGFAAGVDLTPDEAVKVADQAVDVARLCAPLRSERIELAPEPAYGDGVWVSSYDIDPFDVPDTEKVEHLAQWSARLLAAAPVHHVDASVHAVRENKFYADLAGTVTTQQRVRVHPEVSAVWVDADAGRFETMRTTAPPTGRGWEYLTGTGWDFDQELAQLPEQLGERAAAPTVQAGNYDLVIDPTNLWLTIHESVGHATELDRALGYEANYAGTTFATPDKLGHFAYGSPAMQVTGDRQVEHGLATVGYDDEGVAGQTWDLVRDGVFVGYQLDRRMAQRQGFGRSNGCAFADSPHHPPLQRMANVSLLPAPDGPSTEELIGQVDRGIYVVGDKSWSIDMQRYNFQFTGQRFYAIRGGRLAGQLRDVAYQSSTPRFWASLEAVGGPQTHLLGGAMNCGKGQPGQVAPVSHGCPSALFRDVRILDTTREGGR